jgi:hypothetical protein
MAEIIPPPSFYFSGINFNPAFYTASVSSGGLTQAQANDLYLRKTVPDTAAVLETFSGGIKANTIDGTTTTSAMTLGSNLLSGGYVTIGSSPSVVNIKNDSASSGSVNIMNGSLSGGSVNIGSSGTYTSLDGSVDIGNSATITNLRGTLNINTTTFNNTTIGNTGTITINKPLTIGYSSYPTVTSVIGGFKTASLASSSQNVYADKLFMPVNGLDAGMYYASAYFTISGASNTTITIYSAAVGCATALTSGTLISAITPVYTGFRDLGLSYNISYVNTGTMGGQVQINMAGCFIATTAVNNVAVILAVGNVAPGNVTISGAFNFFRIG